MGLQQQAQFDLLKVQVYTSRSEMGIAAGEVVSTYIRQLLQQQETVRMIFAAAPSQNEVLAYLAADESIDWSRIDAFHMDEYIGLPQAAPQRFSTFLMEHLFEKVKPRNVYLIDDSAGLETTLTNYTKLLQQAPVDIVCLGIGENGHLAFNDPPVADFEDPATMKEVLLDDTCRQQQVNDGCFSSFDTVPEKAITLTIPTLMAGRYLFCVVPGRTKSNAIKNVLTGDITTACPASILRRHSHCILYTDKDGFSLV